MRSVTFIFILAAAVALGLEQAMTNVVAQVEPEAQKSEIEELTPEEIEAELKRAQELLDDPDAPTEFIQAKPLPADIAIDMPSDI